MQLTKHTDLALRVLIHLALKPQERATITEVAEIYNVSRNHLVKVVHELAKKGYIDSVQGRGGGISLALAAEGIKVGDVVRDMEQTLLLADCVGTECPLTESCILKGAFREGLDALLAVLDKYTVADLVGNKTQLLRLIG